MPKSSDDTPGRKVDGRRNNKTPEHSRVKPGQVLNKHGRRGKPKAKLSTRIDELYEKEADRIVSHDGDEPVDARARLVREEFYAALVQQDPAIRARLLARLHEIDARTSIEDQEFLDHVRTRKAELTREFYFAKLSKAKPPDVIPHPDHVVFEGKWPSIRGPIDHNGRRLWEELKAAIRVAAYFHERARAEHKLFGTAETAKALKDAEQHRRRLMRPVPKGWNWREEIYSRDGMLEFAKDVVRDLKEIPYGASADSD
jgi:hypothetical protein